MRSNLLQSPAGSNNFGARFGACHSQVHANPEWLSTRSQQSVLAINDHEISFVLAAAKAGGGWSKTPTVKSLPARNEVASCRQPPR
jgi:hypothetical protein